ncbi:ABC transporter permease [Desulfitobacterium chlororespirans]|uniref:Peptide/nickel transport system permease protein n=1 Tax=Desulfitobacterium chlororespirans DSM 11544 TaxID=1121395 RepID=A0A1M7SK49_9FIRM|nr:ABC transporter permease [Desulfitobacterium chlororespirans]SHN58809.1 peptide/nickel transport system permease protein [Desulfitobacterium chlororespirans DSM 11544]
MDNLANYLGKKMFEVILTLLFVTFLSFLLMRLSPIDAATAYVTRNTAIVTQEQIEAARIEMGLNKPLLVQYGLWLKNALGLDLGTSLENGYAVTREIGKAIPVSLAVVGLAGGLMAVGILVFGALAYFLRSHLLGYLLTFLCIAGISVPPFYTASLFIDIFAVKLGWLSVTGNAGLMRFVPAALCLALFGISLYSQLFAQGLEREMKEDYAFYARCRGLSELRILLFHAFPHVAASLLPSLMQALGLFLAGITVIEQVFSLPGIGSLIIHSVIQRDSPVIHALVLFLALAIVLLNVASDVAQRLLLNHQNTKERAG